MPSALTWGYLLPVGLTENLGATYVLHDSDTLYAGTR
jgi:hypothetical protein